MFLTKLQPRKGMDEEEHEEDEKVMLALDKIEKEYALKKKERLEDDVVHCFSGGAIGADFIWTSECLKRKYKVTICSFVGHSSSIPIGSVVVNRLTEEELNEANDSLKVVAQRLKRKTPKHGSYSCKLLQRNYHIVKDVEATYAIGYRDDKSPGLGVEGGTAYGCEMFHLTKNENLFLYDMNTNKWYQGRRDKWSVIPLPPPLSTFRRIALIGSREVTKEGEREIQLLLT